MSDNAYEKKMLRQLEEIDQAAQADKEARRIANQTVDEYKAEKQGKENKEKQK